jgi:glycosyltransferase involved in cell wall biosynthesis
VSSCAARPLRVAQLISGDLWAGAEVALYHLLVALAQRGELQVCAVLLNPGQLAEALAAARIETRVVPEQGRSFASLARAVRAALGDAQLVHAHRYKENALAALSGRPWLTTWHGRPECPPGAAGLRMRAHLLADGVCSALFARRVVVVSRELEPRARRCVGRRRTAHCWNGIADPLRGAAPRPWASRAPVVGALGRLFPVKGFELAVRAAALCPGLQLEIAGEGPERPRLEREIAQSGAADRIRLLGHLADPLPRLASWRALLVTSHHEGNPIGVLEALALGTPVLAAELPGIREIAGEQGAVLQAGREPAHWAQALARLASDAPAAERLAAVGRRRFAEHFTAEAAAARMAELYRAALHRGARAPARPSWVSRTAAG